MNEVHFPDTEAGVCWVNQFWLAVRNPDEQGLERIRKSALQAWAHDFKKAMWEDSR